MVALELGFESEAGTALEAWFGLGVDEAVAGPAVVTVFETGVELEQVTE